MKLKLSDYSDEEEHYLRGFVKISLEDKNVALLEIDEDGIRSLIRFIIVEIINDEIDSYSYYHFSYMPQVEQTDIAIGSLDFFIEKTDVLYLEKPIKGKLYSQFGYENCDVPLGNTEMLFEENSTIMVQKTSEFLISLSCNTEGFYSFCKYLWLMIQNNIKELHLREVKGESNTEGELINGSMDLHIVKVTS